MRRDGLALVGRLSNERRACARRCPGGRLVLAEELRREPEVGGNDAQQDQRAEDRRADRHLIDPRGHHLRGCDRDVRGDLRGLLRHGLPGGHHQPDDTGGRDRRAGASHQRGVPHGARFYQHGPSAPLASPFGPKWVPHGWVASFDREVRRALIRCESQGGSTWLSLARTSNRSSDPPGSQESNEAG